MNTFRYGPLVYVALSSFGVVLVLLSCRTCMLIVCVLVFVEDGGEAAVAAAVEVAAAAVEVAVLAAAVVDEAVACFIFLFFLALEMAGM